MKTPLISIIVPTYNRAKLIGKTLDSVLKQAYTNWECIVVDDGSDDVTLDVLKSYHEKDSRLVFFVRQREPKGAPTCRNIGLEHAKGKFVIFLDSDDYLLPFCLEQRVNALKENPNCDFLVFPMGIQKKDGIIKQEITRYDDYLIPFLSAILPWQTMCPIWKKPFLIELKGFTEGYPRFNDPELMIRAILMKSVKFKVLQDLNYDTVHIPSDKASIGFINKVFKSLCLFIPDICNALDKAEKLDYKKYLAYYLHLWFKYIYIPLGTSDIKQSLQLIRMFKKQDIISYSKAISFNLRLLLYATSKMVFKNPINKLSDKSLYV